MKKILEYWPLITGCILYFGFCNLYFYYKTFNIDILSFSKSNDLLFSLFPQAVVISTIIYGYLVQSIFFAIQESEIKNVEIPIQSVKKINRIKWFQKNITIITIIYYIIITIVKTFLVLVLKFKSYELTEFNIFTGLIFLLLIYYAIKSGNHIEFINNNSILLALFLIVYIGNGIGNYRRSEAEKIKDGITYYTNDHITFDYDIKKVKTSKTLLFIGQTTDFIFLYNIKNKNSEIYKNSKVENLIIK